MSGWSSELFNNNGVPMSHAQMMLRAKVVQWMNVLYQNGVFSINSVQLGEMFPGDNYYDLMLYEEIQRDGLGSVESIGDRL